jgi:hypothetical protein
MSLVEITRVEKAIAFGGVAIGSMKAKEQAIVTEIIKAFGLIPRTMASSARGDSVEFLLLKQTSIYGM